MRLSGDDGALHKRLSAVYFALVEMEHGDQMDEDKEKDAIVRLGRLSWTFDDAQNLKGDERLCIKLGATFTQGTSEEGTFLSGYSDAARDAPANKGGR